MSPYHEILRRDEPLPSINEFIKISNITDKELYGLVMESLHLDIHHSPDKQALLYQTKQVLEKRIILL